MEVAPRCLYYSNCFTLLKQWHVCLYLYCEGRLERYWNGLTMSLWAKCLVYRWVEWSLWLLEHFTVLINVLQIQWYHLFTAPTIYTHSKSKLLPLFQIKGPFCDIGSVCLNKIVIFDRLDVLDEDFYDKIEHYVCGKT